MKKTKLIIGMLVALSASLCLAQNGHDLFQKALVKERTEGDLEAAIALHERIAKECADERPLAAKALLHLGQCYEKLGKDEARKTYERLVQDYADQTEVVAEARTRLVALSQPAGSEKGFLTRQVWVGADGVFDGAPSPDGKYLSYLDWGSGNLAVRSLEAQTNWLVTTEGTWDEPAQYTEASRWSPDGRQIVYTWNTSGSGSELRILTVDDPKPMVLIREEADAGWVSPEDWSPDGQHVLARFSTGPVSRQLALVPVQGGPARVLKNFEPGTVSSGEARFSPDGRYVVYDHTPGKVAALDLFVLDVNTGLESPLVQHPADDCVFGWAPDGDWVLFLSDRAGTLDLLRIRVVNGKPQGDTVTVKRSVGRIAPLGFAKDGSFYYAEVKVSRDVYTTRVDFETGKILAPAAKAIVKFEGANMNPRYSPDGNSLAYVSRRGSMVFPTAQGNALCVYSFETGQERTFTDEFAKLGVRAVAGPRWSPDGGSIVVAGLWVVGARSGLYRVNLDTGEIKPVAESPSGVRVRNHEWSREPHRLFCLRDDSNRRLSQLIELDLRTGQERELCHWPGNDGPSGIAVAPDGRQLALRMGPVLAVMPADGGTPRAVHRFEEGTYTTPEWTPDGKGILIGLIKRPGAKGILYNVPVAAAAWWARDLRSPGPRGTLYQVPLEGERPKEIVLEKGLWDRPSVHPDGQQIAFTTPSNFDCDADVWLMENFLPNLTSPE